MAISKSDRERLQRYALAHPLAAGYGEATQWHRYRRRDHWIILTVEKSLIFDYVGAWHAQMMRINPVTESVLPWDMLAGVTKARDMADLNALLDGVGRKTRNFICRDNAILHHYREINGDEWESFDAEYLNAEPLPTIGGPVEILYESRPGNMATRPCVNMIRHRPEGQPDPLQWVAVDCGQCEPCQARATAESPKQRQDRIFREEAERKGVMSDDGERRQGVEYAGRLRLEVGEEDGEVNEREY